MNANCIFLQKHCSQPKETLVIFEPCHHGHDKNLFLYSENKCTGRLCVHHLDSYNPSYFLNPKYQASAVQLCRTWSEIPKTGFVVRGSFKLLSSISATFLSVISIIQSDNKGVNSGNQEQLISDLALATRCLVGIIIIRPACYAVSFMRIRLRFNQVRPFNHTVVRGGAVV